MVAKDRVKVEKLLDGLDMTRARADRVLYQADQSSPARAFSILARSRAEIERSMTNVRDATDWGNKLVQKIYTNPFVLESVLQALERRPARPGRLRHCPGLHQGRPGIE